MNYENKYKVWHYKNEEGTIEVLGFFAQLEAARSFVLKCGDQNILAHVGFNF